MTVQEQSSTLPPESDAEVPEADGATDWFGAETSTFGDRLAGAREAAGLTQSDLALKLGVKLGTLRRWEDDLAEPRANRLQMLSGILNVSLRWLLTAEGDGPSESDLDGLGAGDLRAVLKELREVQADMRRNGERLAVLEKRLRRQVDGGLL